MYYESDYYVYFCETNTYAHHLYLCLCIRDEAVGVQRDSFSLKSLNECLSFS
jgi:hypothetical protein